MHVLTLVICPGDRSSAYEQAGELYGRAANQGFDYWYPGGRFSGRLADLGLLPEGDEWPDAIESHRLPSPLPAALVPPALITPRGAFLWRPLDEREAEAWAHRVNRLVDKYRADHTVVLMDGHC